MLNQFITTFFLGDPSSFNSLNLEIVMFDFKTHSIILVEFSNSFQSSLNLLMASAYSPSISKFLDSGSKTRDYTWLKGARFAHPRTVTLYRHLL